MSRVKPSASTSAASSALIHRRTTPPPITKIVRIASSGVPGGISISATVDGAPVNVLTVTGFPTGFSALATALPVRESTARGAARAHTSPWTFPPKCSRIAATASSRTVGSNASPPTDRAPSPSAASTARLRW